MKIGAQSIVIALAGMIALATAGLLVHGLLKPAPVPLPPGNLVSWEADSGPDPAHYASDGLRLSISPKASKADDRVAPSIRIEGAGQTTPHQLDGQFAMPGMPHRFGTLRLAPGQHAAVLLATPDNRNGYCCEVLLVAAPVAGGLSTIRVGELAGDGLQSMPADVSGDGVVDFILPDRSFSGAFGSVADSPLPSTIVNILGGKAVDVSAQPQFTALFRQEMAQFANGCSPGVGGPRVNPACAAYVAAATRVAAEQAAWEQMLKAHDSGLNPAFPEQLKSLLIDAGYLPATSDLPTKEGMNP